MHEMRRSDRRISEDDCIKIIIKGNYGVLATVGDDGFPYGVPLSYVFFDGKIYFHCAKKVGHKLSNMNFQRKCSFTIVTRDETRPEQFSVDYESVIIFGELSFELEDKQKVLEHMVSKYSPDYKREGAKYIQEAQESVDVVRIDILKMTGKARKSR